MNVAKDNKVWNKKDRKIMEWGEGDSWRSQRLEAIHGCPVLHKEDKDSMMIFNYVGFFAGYSVVA